MEQRNEHFPVIVRSRTLLSTIYKLDSKLEGMEAQIEFLEKENSDLKKEISTNIFNQLDQGNHMMAQTLMACLAVPDDISSLGTVGLHSFPVFTI